MAEIGFIGLGIMGRPMVKNLLKAVDQIRVYDINPDAVARCAADGVRPSLPDEMAAACDIIFLILPDGPASETALFGEDGFAFRLRRDTLICDMTSMRPEEAQSMAARLSALGVDHVDAPVSGGEQGAVQGNLAIMAGGAERCLKILAPYFAVLGSSVTHVGGHGAGCAAKLINQVLVSVNFAAVCEAFTLGKKLGVDAATVFAAIRGGSAASAAMESRFPRLISRDFTPGATVDTFYKDLGNVLASAHSTQTPMPLTAALYEMLDAARAYGFEKKDLAVLVTVFEKLANIGDDDEWE